MVNNITVAWATLVDTVKLGARLEAYVKTKAAVHIFKLCIRYAHVQGSALGKLPPEMAEIIPKYLQLPVFEEHRSRRPSFAANLLAALMIISEYRALKEKYIKSTQALIDDQDFEDIMKEEYIGDVEHARTVEQFLDKINEHPNKAMNSTRFDKRRKIFAEDFKLEIRFCVFSDYKGNSGRNPATTALAYLILPSVESDVNTSSGPGNLSYLSSMIVDPPVVGEPSAAQKALFKMAMIKLQLEPVVHELQIPKTRPTSDRPPLPEKKENKFPSYFRKSTESQKQANALASTDWPKLMVLASGERNDKRTYPWDRKAF